MEHLYKYVTFLLSKAFGIKGSMNQIKPSYKLSFFDCMENIEVKL